MTIQIKPKAPGPMVTHTYAKECSRTVMLSGSPGCKGRRLDPYHQAKLFSLGSCVILTW